MGGGHSTFLLCLPRHQTFLLSCEPPELCGSGTGGKLTPPFEETVLVSSCCCNKLSQAHVKRTWVYCFIVLKVRSLTGLTSRWWEDWFLLEALVEIPVPCPLASKGRLHVLGPSSIFTTSHVASSSRLLLSILPSSLLNSDPPASFCEDPCDDVGPLKQSLWLHTGT